MANKAIILSRVSSNHQTLEQQTEAVLKEVRKDGYTDDNIIIIEDKESAIKLSEEERNGLNRMKEYISNDPSINAVYLYELSRLSRRQTMLFNIRDYLIERKIQLICLQPYMKLLDEDGKMSTTAAIIFALYSTLSETEMTVKKERMLRGRYYNRALGKHSGGRPPFGYTTDKDKFYIIHPKNAEILKRIFSEYVNEGKSMWVITKELKEEGLFENTSPHTLFHSIDYWLSRDIYVGSSVYPQIISETMYKKAQKERDAHKRGPKKSHKNIFLLKGLVFDEKNGLPMFGERTMEAYCETKGYGCCIKRQYLDPLVWDYAKTLYQKHIMNKSIYRRHLQKDLETIRLKLNTLKEESKTIIAKVDKVEERMIFGNLSTNRGEELIFKLKEQNEEKERRILELTNESVAKHQQLIDIDIKDMFDENSMTLDEKIAIVKKVIKKVTVKRPSKYTAHISIFNRINDTVVVYESKSNGRYKDRGVRVIDKYHLKEKKTS
ncbi:MAG: recombinase family protein [Bacteroidales bacterium]|nr:recombinase family protein [Bacteroidales bacterium]